MDEKNVWRAEITTKLSGIIYERALLTGSFEKVYSRVLEWLEEIPEEEFDTVHALEVLGDIGG